MKAIQIIERGQPVFVEAPKPQLRAGHAIIKTLRLSLCGSDVRHIHYLPDGSYPTQAGETGHEMVGVIEAINPVRDVLQVGQRVLCLAPDHRAMSEYYLAPINHLLPLDPATPLKHSVQAQQFGTVLYASQILPDLHGKTVAVIGQGSAGSMVQLRAATARRSQDHRTRSQGLPPAIRPAIRRHAHHPQRRLVASVNKGRPARSQ